MDSSRTATGLVVIGEATRSFDAIRERGRRAASAFHALGIREGDAIALVLRNDFAFLEATHAADLLGAYVVPINWHFAPEEVSYVLTDCAAKAVVAHADLLPGLAAVLPPAVPVIQVDAGGFVDGTRPEWEQWLSPHTPWGEPPRASRSTMIYTSGTTGKPKGVKRQPATPAHTQARGTLLREVYGDLPGMRALVAGPLYHTGPNTFARYAMQGCELMLLQSKFDAEQTLAEIDAWRLTHALMVPTMLVRMMKLPQDVRDRYDVSSLRNVVHSAAPCPADVKKAVIDWWGPIVTEVYGSTEVGMPVACTAHEWLGHPGTVGRPVTGARIAVYDDDGKPLADGEVGEIFLGCDAYPDFYYHKRDPQARTVRDGLVSIGDVGYLKDGFLYLCDRKVDMVISGGVNIYPAEIEQALLQHPAVRDCAVFGVPHEDMGEVVMAVVELAAGGKASGEALRDFLGMRLAPYKIPRRYEFADALPREASGKIMKRRLRDVHWQGQARRI